MDKIKKENKFSVKKLGITMIISILISLGVGMINLSLLKIGNYCEFFAIREITGNYENREYTQNEIDALKKYGNEIGYSLEVMQNDIEVLKQHENLKDANVNIDEIFYHQMMDSMTAVDIINCFDVYVSFGILIGALVYIAFIKNSKGKKLVFELIISVVLFVVFIYAKKIGMELIINFIIKNLTGGINLNFKFLDDASMSNNIYIICAITICVIIYVLNLIVNEIKVRKMNKELNNK